MTNEFVTTNLDIFTKLSPNYLLFTIVILVYIINCISSRTIRVNLSKMC